MIIVKNRSVQFLIILSTIILINFICFEIAPAANNTQIIIDENLKPGMILKDAIELLGSPERITVSNNGTIVIPYNTLGLSIEIMNNRTVIEGIHLQSTFRGQFASGLEIGVDSQKILSVYNQPDIMTKEIIEYFDIARIFQIRQGKLVGADLYSKNSKLYRQMPSDKTEKHEEVQAKVSDEVREKIREEVRQEIHDEAQKEIHAFDLFGFKVKKSYKGVIITEITPASVAEYGGLKVGEPVRKAFYKRSAVSNIYSVGGLESILKRAINKGEKTINILQKKNYYYKVEVPRRK